MILQVMILLVGLVGVAMLATRPRQLVASRIPQLAELLRRLAGPQSAGSEVSGKSEAAREPTRPGDVLGGRRRV